MLTGAAGSGGGKVDERRGRGDADVELLCRHRLVLSHDGRPERRRGAQRRGDAAAGAQRRSVRRRRRRVRSPRPFRSCLMCFPFYLTTKFYQVSFDNSQLSKSIS